MPPLVATISTPPQCLSPFVLTLLSILTLVTFVTCYILFPIYVTPFLSESNSAQIALGVFQLVTQCLVVILLIISRLLATPRKQKQDLYKKNFFTSHIAEIEHLFVYLVGFFSLLDWIFVFLWSLQQDTHPVLSVSLFFEILVVLANFIMITHLRYHLLKKGNRMVHAFLSFAGFISMMYCLWTYIMRTTFLDAFRSDQGTSQYATMKRILLECTFQFYLACTFFWLSVWNGSIHVPEKFHSNPLESVLNATSDRDVSYFVKDETRDHRQATVLAQAAAMILFGASVVFRFISNFELLDRRDNEIVFIIAGVYEISLSLVLTFALAFVAMFVVSKSLVHQIDKLNRTEQWRLLRLMVLCFSLVTLCIYRAVTEWREKGILLGFDFFVSSIQVVSQFFVLMAFYPRKSVIRVRALKLLCKKFNNTGLMWLGLLWLLVFWNVLKSVTDVILDIFDSTQHTRLYVTVSVAYRLMSAALFYDLANQGVSK
mmetsp:Transcript_5998/g.22720  ORF Transcript_5998/g.22720 Transcript_5998/m.22720 type:complete len:486 (-) Transcript_5998:107-1564(-)|eukprot:CAMPEP_0117440952 /NCGR_PEP_ID=MMETSP0759-20121206/3366_1 /TAXON_ID=63605 /ORGANISM="Percolomonas cosmopolitus, Strain WS" /LENGTH=485 /DNA_ID=CAMNT_0005232755 /DNA_START=49 /DNA_END=1506 /DNA_ORIENTATION=-